MYIPLWYNQQKVSFKDKKTPKHERTQSQSVVPKSRVQLIFDNLISSQIKATFLHKVLVTLKIIH